MNWGLTLVDFLTTSADAIRVAAKKGLMLYVDWVMMVARIPGRLPNETPIQLVMRALWKIAKRLVVCAVLLVLAVIFVHDGGASFDWALWLKVGLGLATVFCYLWMAALVYPPVGVVDFASYSEIGDQTRSFFGKLNIGLVAVAGLVGIGMILDFPYHSPMSIIAIALIGWLFLGDKTA